MSTVDHARISTLALLTLLAACGPNGEPETPEPTPTQAPGTPTVEETPTATQAMATDTPATPTAEATDTPATPTASPATPTAEPGTPTATPSPTPEPTPPLNGTRCANGKIELDGYCVPDLDGGWEQIFPEGDTICSRGTPFSYFVRKGTVNKLVVGFDGGGACWDAITCSESNPTFSETVNNGDNPENIADGALDFTDPENPVKDWFMVFVPYCTGDIHWGNAETTYPRKATYPEVTIHHKGFVNGQAVMNWVYKHFEKPESIFVTGVSAGAYGSLMFAPYLMDHYPDSRIVQNGDSGVGVITEEFLSEDEGIKAWNVQENIPDFFPEIKNAPIEELSFSDVYIAAAEYFPDQVFSQYNTAEDDVQKVFYATMGGQALGWNAQMEQLIGEITDAVPNFKYYTAWGTKHGILPYNEFYTYQVNGVRLRDWFSDLIHGNELENVHCSNCVDPELYTPTPAGDEGGEEGGE